MSAYQATEIEVAILDRGPAQRMGGRSYWSESWRRLLENRLGVTAGAVILLLALVAISAPLITHFIPAFDPTHQDLDSQFASPGRQHWLGADELGRDTLTRLVYGAQVSLGVGFLTVAIQLVVGGGVGLASGFYGGWVDETLMRLVDMVLAIPALFLYILMSILFRPSTITLSIIIATVGWGIVARLVRGEVLSLKNRDFILASRSIGARPFRIIVRHLMPNALPVMIVAASLTVGTVILAEAALDFLGLGIHQPTASWGNMLTNAQTYYIHSSLLVVLPGVMIFITVLAANLFGNSVRDAFDPRLTDSR